jgi:RNA polymerase sigma-70 factor (ECF subfamily)
MTMAVNAADAVAAPLAEAHPKIYDFASVYAAWFGAVERWSRWLGGPSADVEDTVQEIFVVVQRKLPGFIGERAQLASWLYAITLRTVRDQRRRAWFRRVILGRDGASAELVDENASSHAALERKQAQARFYRIVGKMSAKWRDSFVLFEVLGHSGEEVAALTGLPHATVRTHLHRARKEFLALVASDAERDA